MRLPVPRFLRRMHKRYLMMRRSVAPALAAARSDLRNAPTYLRAWSGVSGYGKPAALLEFDRSDAPVLTHVGAFGIRNAGDTLLTVNLRDLFDQRIRPHRWRMRHVRLDVDTKAIAAINRTNGLVIGGGGLFLGDTYANSISGWQWPAPEEAIRAIRVPKIVFAVGYNRFRGQADFPEYFTRSVRALVETSAFFGLRNNGSVKAIQGYLPEELRSRVVFQPCMTTLIGEIYPDRVRHAERRGIIALNCAFDRVSLRLGDDVDAVLERVADAMKHLAADHEIHYYSHMDSDQRALRALDAAKVPYRLVNLSGRTPEQVIEAYRIPDLVLGMRGHAQMIPFGIGVPILSLVSHDKLRWFLDDIGHTEWAIEMSSEHLTDEIVDSATAVLAHHDETVAQVADARRRLLSVTEANLAEIDRALS